LKSAEEGTAQSGKLDVRQERKNFQTLRRERNENVSWKGEKERGKREESGNDPSDRRDERKGESDVVLT